MQTRQTYPLAEKITELLEWREALVDMDAYPNYTDLYSTRGADGKLIEMPKFQPILSPELPALATFPNPLNWTIYHGGTKWTRYATPEEALNAGLALGTLALFGKILTEYSETASGESYWAPGWCQEPNEPSRTPNGVMVFGGDMDHGCNSDIMNSLWAALESAGLECTSADMCSMCDGCEDGSLVGTNYDDEFLVTDGAIYCRWCAADLLREAVIDADKHEKRVDDYAAYPGPSMRDLRNLLSNWQVSIGGRTLRDIFGQQGWECKKICQYPQGDDLTHGEARELLAEIVANEQTAYCFFQGGYSWETYVAYLQPESESEEEEG